VSGGTVEITELIDVCERMTAINHALFEQLGEWVADETDPVRQQWFAVACHRHAWHAELWAERRPKVPLDVTAAADTTVDGPDERTAWYTGHLTRLQQDLVELEVRLDPVLDPSTTRVIQLVAADLGDLVTSSPPP
jgi:hypothetical protein